MLYINFWQNELGYHFGRFFHKLIRSHWLRPSSYLLLVVMLEATTPPSIR
jgi:hypothetical protein